MQDSFFQAVTIFSISLLEESSKIITSKSSIILSCIKLRQIPSIYWYDGINMLIRGDFLLFKNHLSGRKIPSVFIKNNEFEHKI